MEWITLFKPKEKKQEEVELTQVVNKSEAFVTKYKWVLLGGIVALIAFMEQAQRRIQILYPRQAMANGVMNTNASYLPIKVNMSGVMGPVFAASIMMLPAFVQRFVQSENLFVQNNWLLIVSIHKLLDNMGLNVQQ